MDITHSITNLVRCSEEDAEDLKRNVGFSEEILRGDAVPATSRDYNLYSAIEHQMDRLIAEMKRSLVFFYAQYEEQDEPEILYLTGGTSRIPNLTQFIDKKLDTRVEIVDPLEAIPHDLENNEGFGTQLSMAVGLAMRGS